MPFSAIPPQHSERQFSESTTPHIGWIVSQSALSQLGTVMTTTQLRTLFNHPYTYVIVNLANVGDPLPDAKHVAYYRDETLVAQDLAVGNLAAFDGVLYDDEAYNEPGNTTPSDQIANPLPYVQDAARVLHAAGKVFLYTIGFNVGPSGLFWSTTLPSVSPYADITDFQTQGAEGTSQFAALVTHLTTVYRGNGGHLMFAGLAVDPQGVFKTAVQIRSGYHAGLANSPPVDGFWFNIATQSASCTGCSPDPNIMPGVNFLLWLLQNP